MDDTHDADLRQIKDRTHDVLNTIDRIRERDPDAAEDLNDIQRDALKIIYEIDEIQKRRNYKTQSRIGAAPAGRANADRSRGSLFF